MNQINSVCVYSASSTKIDEVYFNAARQLGLYLNPIVILNTNGFFDPLLDMLTRAIDENFMRRQHGEIWHVATTPEEAVKLIYTVPVWDASIRKFAAI